MVDIQPLVGESTLNVSRLNTPTKRRLAESILKIQLYAVYMRLT